jgi:hypothetical protein
LVDARLSLEILLIDLRFSHRYECLGTLAINQALSLFLQLWLALIDDHRLILFGFPQVHCLHRKIFSIATLNDLLKVKHAI